MTAYEDFLRAKVRLAEPKGFEVEPSAFNPLLKPHQRAIAASSRYDSGRFSVADPRIPAADERLTCIIRSLDGTWHRPFTTLEKAALQSLVEPEEYLVLDGMSDKDWSERIGNAVPPAAAEAIAGVMGTTLLLAEAGETFMLSNTPIWVRPVAVALSVAQQEVQP